MAKTKRKTRRKRAHIIGRKSIAMDGIVKLGRKLPKRPKKPKQSASLASWERYAQRYAEWERKVSDIKTQARRKHQLIQRFSH